MNSAYRNIKQYLLFALLIFLPCSFLTPIVMYQLRDNNRLIMIDGRNSYHVSEYADQERLVEIYQYVAKLACDAFLMRNPNGLDLPRQFDEMFVDKARETALNQVKIEMPKFYAEEIHQKVEILNVKVMEADSKNSFVRISGQLIRSYRKEALQSAYAVKFELSLNLIVNYDLGKNANYPFVVSDMKYQIIETNQ